MTGNPSITVSYTHLDVYKRQVRDVVSTERDKIMAEILTNVAKRAEPLGVQIVDVRLRRIEFAPEISESVYRRMEAERTRVANELRSIGAAEGEKILSLIHI